MRALLLAAGRGSRMGGLTDERPKCLTPLAGRALLSWQVAALEKAGVADVGAIGGYRADALAPYVPVVATNDRWAESNMVTTLRAAASILRAEPCIVAYTDIVYRPGHVAALAEADGDVVVTYDTDWLSLWSARFEDPLSDAESFVQRDGVLREIGARSASVDAIQGQYMGLLKIMPAGWAGIERTLEKLGPAAVDRLDMTALLQRLLAEGATIRTVAVSGGWCEVDSADDIRLYERLIAKAERRGEKWRHDWRWAADDEEINGR